MPRSSSSREARASKNKSLVLEARRLGRYMRLNNRPMTRSLGPRIEEEIPVYLGSNERLITPAPVTDPADQYYGSDGFADVEFPDLPSPNVTLLQNSAVQNMAALINRYPREITLIALGPLTNVALLIKMYPAVRDNLKQIFIMGGNRHGVGNTESAAEFNFYSDPESANIVINNFEQSITLLPWETASKEELAIDRTWRFDVLGSADNPVVEILNAVESKVLRETDSWLPCDLLVPMVFANPSLITDQKHYHGDVELYGGLTRGMLVLDYKNEGIGNIGVIDNINKTMVEMILLDLVSLP
ncbi:nucleoside hydrolase-like [Uranotaenia lowii]|uniref:nucleoside hydrolase-like n=1 Tax=Uranotaenia lowii TaxID=190385 RepID=UPI00247AEFD1|nr:nucleoside hydrolase-like [Uranotaenia lowii]